MNGDFISVSRLARLFDGSVLPIPPYKRETFYQYWNRLLAMKKPELVTQILESLEAPSIEALEQRFAYTKHGDGNLNELYGEIWALEKAFNIPGMDSLSHPPDSQEAIWECQMRLKARLDSCTGTSKQEQAEEDLIKFYHLLGCGCEDEYLTRLNEDDERPLEDEEVEVHAGGAPPPPPSGGVPPTGGTADNQGGSSMARMKWTASASGFPGAHTDDELGQAFLRRWGAIGRMPKERQDSAKEDLVRDLKEIQPEAAGNIALDKLRFIAGHMRAAYGEKYESEAEAPLGSAPPTGGGAGDELKLLDDFYQWGEPSKDKLTDGDEQPVILFLFDQWTRDTGDASRNLVIKKMAEAYPGYAWTVESIDQVLAMDPEVLANKRPPADDKGKGASGGKLTNEFAGKKLVTTQLAGFWAAPAAIMVEGAEGSIEAYLKAIYTNPPEGKSATQAVKDFFMQHSMKFPSTVTAKTVANRMSRKDGSKPTTKKAPAKKTTTKKAPAKKAAAKKTTSKKAAQLKAARKARVDSVLGSIVANVNWLVENVAQTWPRPTEDCTALQYMARLKGVALERAIVCSYFAAGLDLADHLEELGEAFDKVDPIMPEAPPPPPVELSDEERQLWQAMTDQMLEDHTYGGFYRTMMRDGDIAERAQLEETVRELVPGPGAEFILDKSLGVSFLRHWGGLDKLPEPVVTSVDRDLLVFNASLRSLPDEVIKDILDHIKSS